MISPAFRKHRSPAKWQRGSFSLPNRLVQDLRLTDSAFRLLSWMVSCSGDWIIYQSDIMKRFDWGETKMRAAIDNLIECRYLFKLGQHRLPNGGWGPCDYEFEAQGFTDDEIKEFQINSPYPDDRGTGDASTGDQGTKQVLSIVTNPNPEVVCIDESNETDKKEEKAKKPEMQQIRRIDKKNGRGIDISLGWDELVTHAVNYKKDWKITEMQEAWKILHERNGFVNDMIEFIGGTITNLRTKTRSTYANKSKTTCKSQQTKKASNETKSSIDSSSNIRSDSAEKGTGGSLLDALKRLGVDSSTRLPPG